MPQILGEDKVRELVSHGTKVADRLPEQLPLPAQGYTYVAWIKFEEQLPLEPFQIFHQAWYERGVNGHVRLLGRFYDENATGRHIVLEGIWEVAEEHIAAAEQQS